MTAGKASMGAFGAIGGALAGESMQSAGNKIIAQNEVTDPAPTIGITLATDLANKYGLKLVHPATAASGKKLAQVAQTYAQQADLVLDVQTRGWGFSYFPVDWNNYYIFYGAKLKLIDTKATEEIAVSSFMYDSKDESNPPSKDQLLANNATVLKQKITTAQNQCIYETRQRIFNAN